MQFAVYVVLLIVSSAMVTFSTLSYWVFPRVPAASWHEALVAGLGLGGIALALLAVRGLRGLQVKKGASL